MFDINFYSKQSEFHRYATEDLALLSIGLGSYNKSSIDEFFNPLKPNPDLIEFFGATGVVANQIRGIGLEGTMQILEFDIIEKVYKLKTGLPQIALLNPQKFPPAKFPPIQVGSIKTFLDDWNRVQNGALTGPMANSYKAIIDKIHNSVSGCLLFKANFSVLGGQRVADIMLTPTYSRDNESSRTISFKGAPLISATPQTAEGMVYSNSLTNQLPIGQYGSPFEGGSNNPKNNVAGNLRLTYDPTTGEFESGTQQILVRLVDDIDPVEMSDISGEALLSSTVEQCYDDPESDVFMGKFTKGRGIPLSMENGNPHMYGPNFKGGCANSSAKSVIIVVNRSPQSFKSGQLVMCSKINGEWIILPTGGQEGLRKKISFGNFEYQQYIIPASKYFMQSDNNSIFEGVLPNDVARKIRNFYYITLAGGVDPKILDPSMNNPAELTLLNIFASTIPSDIEDPLEYIKENYTPSEAAQLLNEADAEKSRDEQLRFLQLFIGLAGQNLFYPDETFNEIINALPKNILSQTARSLVLSSSSGENDSSVTQSATGDPVYGDEVPFFWGMLFPDGYKSESTAQFIAVNRDLFRINPLFANDKNLRELSVLSNLGLPYIQDEVTNLLFINNEINNFYPLTNPLNYVRKSSGLFVTPEMFSLFFGDIVTNLYNQISLNSFFVTGQIYSTHRRFDSVAGDTVVGGKNLFNLEPLKPNRIQFSSMSIEHLYSKSLLDNIQYGSLRSSVDYYYDKFFKNGVAPMSSLWASPVFGDFLFDWWRSDSRDEIYPAGAGSVDEGNAYNIQSLLTQNFDQLTASRHPSPLGTAFLIVPPVRGARRSMVMPVLTCKSKIRTSADSLVFTTNQLFGMAPRVQVSPADINVPIILPIGGGIAWNQPDAPIQVNSFPQWGDRVRSDDIDSFGTTTLHVRIFEGWPIQQTIYLGHCFTPLHFNPSAPDFAKVITYSETGEPSVVDARDELNQLIPGRASVDFRVPTALAGEGKGGSPLGLGASVTEQNLAPYSEWKWNTIRRAKLLTNGGFIYKIKYVGVIKGSISLKTNGKGYAVNDTFIYPDGTEIKILSVGGEGIIGSVEVTEGENGMTSVSTNMQPQYLGSTGKDAVWNNVAFIVKERYGYDQAPKELAPITRLTKSSNNGEGLIEGNLDTTVQLNTTSNVPKEYDIFYFYHNDPTHYSIDRTLAFNGAWAQYATVEINPGA